MRNNKPLKVLQVVGAMNRAGTETMLMNIYRHIDHASLQFDFISYSDQAAHYDQEIVNLGGRIFRLRKTNSVRQIYQIIKKYGPYDAVHAHTLFHAGIANAAAFFAGVKTRIAHAHTTSDNNKGLQRKAYILCMRWLIRTFSTNLLACSNEAGRYLFGEHAPKYVNYAYFPNSIDFMKFLIPPVAAVRKLRVKEGVGNSIVIGHIGRFIEAKNHQFLLEIMKQIVQRDPSIKLLLVGDGDLKQQIEARAREEELFDNIRFVGIRTDIGTLLHSMDVFVFPSLYEGLGVALLEAQACGVPCIVSEAIQPEADVNIGLVTKLSLADGPKVWANNILAVATKKETNKRKIADCFADSGYSLTDGISTLMHLYQSSPGGTYEERHFDRYF